MPPPAFTRIATGFSFLESPRWHDGRLWLSDFYTHRVLTLDAAGRAQTVCEVPAQPSGLGWLPDGRLLVCAMRERRVLRLEPDGRLVVRTDSTAWATQLRLLAPTIVRRLNEELGHGTVTVIDVQGPHLPTWKKGPRSVRDGRGPRDTYG